MDEEELSGPQNDTSYNPTFQNTDMKSNDNDDLSFEDGDLDDLDAPIEEHKSNFPMNHNDDEDGLSDYGSSKPIYKNNNPKPKVTQPRKNFKPPALNLHTKKKQNIRKNNKPEHLSEKENKSRGNGFDQDDLSVNEEKSANPGGDSIFDDRSEYHGYPAKEHVYEHQKPKPAVSKKNERAPPKRRQKNDDEEELSDYSDKQKESIDQEASQYQASLFAELRNGNRNDNDAVTVRSFGNSVETYKVNSSNQIDADSLSIKRSQITVDQQYNNTKNRTKNQLKNQREKREKYNQNSNSHLNNQSDNNNGPMPINKREKIENKKRFSKKQLELVSRKFSEYYAYETNADFKGPKITLRQIGHAFDLGHATIHKLYAEWMDDPYFYERIKRYDKYRKQTKNPERKLTLDRLEHITRLIKENPFLTQYELCVELNKIEDLKIIKCGQRQNMTRTIVGKLLRMGKFRKKRVKCIPKQKNTSKSLEKRFEYCTKYKQILERRAKVYFLDESGFNLYMTRDKAWSRPNEEITVNCPISKGKRFSLIAMIGDDGLAHWRFIEGNYRKFQYLDFIREMFQKLNQTRSPEDAEERWIILDNCAIHDKEQTINLAKEYGINVLYLPSYSPQLNPIENWFHEIKCKLKKINYSGEKQLCSIMERLLKEYEQHDFSNYYHGSLKFVEKGLKKEKF